MSQNFDKTYTLGNIIMLVLIKKGIIKNICQYTIQIDEKSFSCPWDRNKFTSVFMHSTCFKYVVKIFKGSDIQHDISWSRLM